MLKFNKPIKQKKVLVILTGSIACYKVMGIISSLVQKNYSIECVATESALKFVGKSTIEGLIQKPIHTSLYDSLNVMGHIHLVRDCDLVLVAPATANYINKLASGIADDLASTLAMAFDFKKPFLLAPAMNSYMFQNPITQNSIEKLKSLGFKILDTQSGILACGEVGYGKLLDPVEILKYVEKYFDEVKNPNSKNAHLPLKKTNSTFLNDKNSIQQRILITGGGTEEKIDNVRSIINLSTGETAVMIANWLSQLGIQTTLLLSHRNNDIVDEAVKVVRFTDFNSLNELLKSELKSISYDKVFHAAAVSDYRIEAILSKGQKIKANKISGQSELIIKLKPNFKIISKLSSYSKNKKIKIIGFKLTSNANKNEQDVAINKVFANKNVEFVIYNDTSKIDKKKSVHEFKLFNKKSEVIVTVNNKKELLSDILSAILKETV